MTSSFKTTTLIAAIGMIVYTAYVLTRYAIHEFWPMPYHYDLWNDIIERLFFDVQSVSLIIAGIGLWKYRPSEPASKPFRIFTACLLIALIGTLSVSPLYTYSIVGLGYFFPPICWRVLLLISGMVWLFILRDQPIEEASPRSYRVTLILSMLLLALPIILEITSGIALLCGRELVLNLSSAAIKSWVKYIAPTLVLVHFVFPQIKAINTTRNSHCMPGSYNERTFKRNRRITLIVAGLAIAALCAGYLCFYAEKCLYSREGIIYNTIDDIACISLLHAVITLLVSWIMLSIMAFRQLPNPKGYKNYNIICQVVTWGSLLVAFLAPNGVDEVFGMIFVISFCAFFITTAIRVISYSFPTGIDKLKGIEIKEGAIIPD